MRYLNISYRYKIKHNSKAVSPGSISTFPIKTFLSIHIGNSDLRNLTASKLLARIAYINPVKE